MERFIKRMALIIYIILSFFRYPFPVIMTPFPQIVIQNGHKNTLRKKRETGWWNGVKNLLPWMTSYGFPHHSNRFFADALNDVLPIPSPRQPILHICFGWRLTFPSLWRFAVRRHSERTQECLAEKTGNGMVTRSEESITRMASYRFPRYASRSFTFASDDD